MSDELTKTVKSEILNVYDTWLNAYLNGDVITYNEFLDDAYHFIGSTNNEEFLNRKDSTKFFAETSEQLAGKCDLRNEQRTLEQFGELIFITHLFDAWFYNGTDFSYYGRFRFSSTLRKSGEGWRFIYQHFSMPDSKTDEGETIGFNKISEENIQLRDAIRRRTAELEANNRDLEIEGALGRIRAEAVAMKESADLLDIVVTMRTEFTRLGHEAHYFWHMMWLPEKYEKAMTSGDGTRIGFVMELPRHIHGDIPVVAKWEKSDDQVVVFPMDAEEAIVYVDKMVSLGDFKNIDPQAPSHDDIRHIKGLTFIMARTTHGEIGYSLPGLVENPPAEDLDLLVRFAGAFDLAHRRFLDLQKAEAQAREAQIEVSLEKVRGVALALQKSDDMLDVVQALYEQLRTLGFHDMRNAIIDVHNDETETFLDYDYSSDMSRTVTEMSYYGEPFIEEQVRKTQGSHDAFFELILEGQELQNLIELRIKNGEKEDVRLNETDQLTYNLYSFGNGAIGISNFGILSEDQKIVLKRFRNVFTFAYKRYSDVVNAEEKAREAKAEAALEKVRGRSMAMQSSNELPDAALNMFNQLTDLGIAPNRLYIGIIKDDKGLIEMWATAEDGNEIGNRVDFDITKNESVAKIFKGWQEQKKSLTLTMEGKELAAYLKYVNEVLGISVQKGHSQKKRYHSVAFFARGFIGIAAPEEQPKETTQLLERFAAVFNLTYTRYNDLKISEAHDIQAEKDLILLQTEKKKAEGALRKLKATQSQLIQSEKMASLGELTAGIAHEIQNPLNFVNNFSELSNELIDEMKDELVKGNQQMAIEIAMSIKQNLEKITHHGKRADKIVKAMLAHSRKSTGEIVAIDINAYLHEIVNLAFHGMRASKNPISVKLNFNLDKNLGQVKLIGEDFSRVIINLVNNAFDAMRERINKEKNFLAVLTVTSKLNAGKVEISITDNGPGIPAAIKDKILQPFFTTKKGTEGTGLGLSITNDIIKAHGGKLTIQSQLGKTIFQIHLNK